MSGDWQTAFGGFWEEAALRVELAPGATLSPRALEQARTAWGEDAAGAKTQLAPTAVAPSGATRAPGSATDPADMAAVRALPELGIAAGGDPGELELLEVLGQGGMGVVRRARQRSLERDVAVKSLRPEIRGRATVDALLEEARLAAQLDHPNVLPVHALGRDPAGRPLLVLKRIEGETWGALLRRPDHPFWSETRRWSRDPLARNLEILREVCDAVEYAHSRGVLHRDLKPDNVMVGKFGEVYLMDWGLAVQAGAERYAPGGTLAYMAPEMIDGRADERTDVYLLGAVLHEVLTGRHRHVAPSRMGLLAAVARSAPASYEADAPAELAEIANRATDADPARRYPDVAGFRQALVEALAHRGSLELCEAAAARLAELEAEAVRESADPHRVGRLAAEARFGFALARRDWPENPAALAGIRRCLELQAAFEVRRGSPRAAALLLEELRELDPARPPPEALAAEVAARCAEAERRELLVRELDPSVSALARRRLFLAVTLVLGGFLVAIATVVGAGLWRPTYADLIGGPLVGLALLTTVFVALRRTFLRNDFNRRVVTSVMLGIAGIALHRLVSANLGIPVMQIVVNDLALAALGAGVAATAFGVRWVIGVAALGAVGAVIASLRPEPLAVIAGTLAACAVALVVGLVRSGRAVAAEGGEPGSSV